MQDDLGEYVTPLRDDFFVAGADAPLVTVRFTTLKTGSALGVNWSHVLGDAAAFSRFLEDVSIFYNLPYTDLESDEVPTFQPHVRLPPATDAIKEQFKIPILTRLPIGDVFKGYTDSVAQSQRFTVNLTPDDVAHIAAVRLPGDKVTDNDLVCAWWCSVLERAGQPLDWVVQTMNVSFVVPVLADNSTVTGTRASLHSRAISQRSLPTLRSSARSSSRRAARSRVRSRSLAPVCFRLRALSAGACMRSRTTRS